jgi:hypothetical protein
MGGRAVALPAEANSNAAPRQPGCNPTRYFIYSQCDPLAAPDAGVFGIQAACIRQQQGVWAGRKG